MTCVVDAFRDPGADHIVLRHCTGIDAIPTLYQRLPKQAVVSPVGTTSRSAHRRLAMPHPLVTQLRFTRSEFRRAIDGVTADEAARRLGAINPIAWITGHLAWHEQLLWLERAQGRVVAPEVKPCGFGQPACDPSFDEMRAAWQRITETADPYLDGLTTETLEKLLEGGRMRESIGTSLRRLTYHYWFHIGESQAIRQLLGHKDLPTFVGNIGAEAPYVPDAG